MADELSADEARWVFGRAAELDPLASDRLDDDAIGEIARQAGLSERAVKQALSEARGGAIERAEEQRRQRRGVIVRGCGAAILLVAAGTKGIVEGFNDGDLIPFALLALPCLYMRDNLRRIRQFHHEPSGLQPDQQQPR